MPTVTGEEHKAENLSVLTESMSDHELEWYRVRHSLSSLIARRQEMKDFFIPKILIPGFIIRKGEYEHAELSEVSERLFFTTGSVL